MRPGEWHSVRITRSGPRGTLQLDEGRVVTGSSPGPLTELNLELPLYLGGFRQVSLNLVYKVGLVVADQAGLG